MDQQDQKLDQQPTPVGQQPQVQDIVSSAAQSAGSVLNNTLSTPQTVQPENLITVQEPAVPIVAVPQVPEPAVAPSVPAPDLHVADVQPAATVIQPANLLPSEPVVPKSRPKRRGTLIVALVSMLVVGMATFGFYSLYWTNQKVVLNRFKGHVNGVIDATSSTGFDLTGGVAYKLEVSNDFDDKSIAVSANGLSSANGSQIASDVTYNDATINIELRNSTSEDDESPYIYYVKLKGIVGMLKAISTDQTAFGIDTKKLEKYDDKWVSVDLSEALQNSNIETPDEKVITKEQYQELWSIYRPIIQARLIGQKDEGTVYRLSAQKSEKVAGHSVWAYDVSYDKQSFNDMLEALKTATDTSSLEEGQKSSLKQVLEEAKEYISEYDSPYQDYNSDSRTEHKETLWVDKLSGYPIQFTAFSEQFYGSKSESTENYTVSVKSLKPSKVAGSVVLTQSNSFDETKVTGSFSLDNIKKTYEVEGAYTQKSRSAESTNNLTYKLSAQPKKDSDKVDIPDSSIPYKDVFKDVLGTE